MLELEKEVKEAGITVMNENVLIQASTISTPSRQLKKFKKLAANSLLFCPIVVGFCSRSFRQRSWIQILMVES